MSWLLLALLWLAVAAIVMTAFVIVARRADRIAAPPKPACPLPLSANDHALLPRKLRLLSVTVTLLLPALLFTQAGTAQSQILQLPPLHVEGASPSCVDVQVEGARAISFDCLNAKLRAEAQQQGDAAPTITAKDIAGTGAPTTVGTFSYTGTSIRMGNAFGKSAFPQRPPATSFTNALVPTGAR
jgi:hypothetical protein